MNPIIVGAVILLLLLLGATTISENKESIAPNENPDPYEETGKLIDFFKKAMNGTHVGIDISFK